MPVVQVHVTPRGGERYSVAPFGATFALAPECWSGGTTPGAPGAWLRPAGWRAGVRALAGGRASAGVVLPVLRPWREASASRWLRRPVGASGVKPGIHHTLWWWNPGFTTWGFAGAVH